MSTHKIMYAPLTRALAEHALYLAHFVQHDCTHRQAYFLSAMYAFCLIFMTGLLFPLDRAIDTVRSLSHLMPLSFSLAPLNEWMSSGVYGWPFAEELRWLYLQLIVALALVIISVHIARTRL